MNRQRILELQEFYRNELITDIIPFWEKNGIDPVNDGFFNYLDRQGDLLSPDKTGSAQGRGVWLFSTLVREVDDSKTWLALAAGGVRFIREHLYRKSDGRIYGEISEDGNSPLHLGEDLQSEVAVAIGLAAYSRVSGDRKALEEARELYALILRLEKEKLSPRLENPRPVKKLSFTSGMIRLSQDLRAADPENEKAYTKEIKKRGEEVFSLFTDHNRKALMETVSADGSILDGPAGRLVCPENALETIRLLLDEAAFNKDNELKKDLLPLLQWTLELGWDTDCRGFYTYVDAEGRQPLKLEWDLKTWSTHCRAAQTFLTAFVRTGDPFYETWFETIQEYCWDHFPDREKGEWFGYLRRDGSVQMDLKGNGNKNYFILPDFLIRTYLLLQAV